MTPLPLAGWAHRHGISVQAMVELMQVLRGDLTPAALNTVSPSGSEAYAQSQVRLEAARAGVYLFRNNVGAFEDMQGRWIRFGLANDSPALNAKLKSGDLIGVRPLTITPGHVGTVIGQFISRECKPRDWRYTGTEREVAQSNWANLICSLGGDAKFATGPGTI